MLARIAMNGTRLVYEMQSLTPHRTILNISVMPCRRGRNRQIISQFLLCERQTKTIQTHHILDSKERYIMTIDMSTKLMEFTIPHIKSCHTYPPRNDVNPTIAGLSSMDTTSHLGLLGKYNHPSPCSSHSQNYTCRHE